MSTAYPFDSTGTLVSNKIINEPHSVTSPSILGGYLIVPNATPFYGNSLSIVDTNGNTLSEGVDYYLTHPWLQATQSVGQPIYGSITIISEWQFGIFNINYQTIGGEYVSATPIILQDGLIALANQYVDIDWSTAPTAFPPTPHTQALDSFSGMTQIYESLGNIASAISSPTTGIHYDDIAGLDSALVDGFVSPMVTLLNSVHSNNEAIGNMLSVILSSIQGFVFNGSASPYLDHYTIPLPMGFQLKVGSLFYSPGNEPTSINYAAPGFPNKCIHVGGSISFRDPSQAIITDRIYFGPPGTTSVNLLIKYTTPQVPGARLLTYFAIGI